MQPFLAVIVVEDADHCIEGLGEGRLVKVIRKELAHGGNVEDTLAGMALASLEAFKIEMCVSLGHLGAAEMGTFLEVGDDVARRAATVVDACGIAGFRFCVCFRR